ncbi:MAG: YvrJ family protein [Finegoldia magna]|uniref:YvrJ family protein n=1 Tax=Finegoldia magna TaxID=1260 RepID=A0A943L6M6_FINMA|nr:YvrJ family protein [Finegoldia magna]MBS5964477.1 YvrJ family protein [Finegoldia magna]
MDEFLSFVGNVGFPILVTAFLLIRVESRLEDIKISIEKLNAILTNLNR